MTPLLFLALSLAGGIGAAVRYGIDRALAGRVFPLGLVVINLSGSFALGLLTGLAITGLVPDEWRLVLGTGFLGGYTTFSSASLETVQLLRAGRRREAVLFGVGGLVGSLALAAAGLQLGSILL